jgi:dual specificity tyrosine-phosphorylation-regulated kinase 2/3/4
MALSMMRMYGVEVIHCDLKPENIMLCHSNKHKAKFAIKIIDFGLSCLNSKKQSIEIQSKYYRAPEVVLRL